MISDARLDVGYLLGDATQEFADVLLGAIKPPSNLPTWQWIEQNVELSSATSDIPGKVSFDLFPMSKFFFNHSDNPRTRRMTVMVGAQCAKTENLIMKLLRNVVERPCPTMWAMAIQDQCEDFAKDRLYPAFRACPPAFKLAPVDRKLWTKRLLKLDTMTLHLRGSNSKAKLQSSPISLIICDERREWRKGSIGTIRKRMASFSEAMEISAGVPGMKGDELHTDWKEGSQTFGHWRCLQPECQHSQPFRFGRAPSVLFSDPRAMGGVTWPTNEVTKPNGKWDYDEVKKATRLQCEKCGHEYPNTEKASIIKTAHEFHRNPKALPWHVSIQGGQLIMPWSSCDWGEIAVRFLKAIAAMKYGDLEPLKTFITEDLGEPFEPPSYHKQAGDLQNRIGAYKMGQCWMDPANPAQLEPKTVLVLTFDRQHLYIRYLVRQWRSTGQSRLVYFGNVASLDDLRAKQFELKIKDRCMWGDDRGGQVSAFRQKALMWNWNILIGEEYNYFHIQHKEDGRDKSYRQGWRETQLDPGIGTTREGNAMKQAFLWSNPWYKDKLYFLFVRGLDAPLWEIPEDVPADYLAEMNANEYRQKDKSDGSQLNYWHETGPDHAADCELEQTVVADISNLTRSRRPPPETVGQSEEGKS